MSNMKKLNFQIPIAIVCLVLAFALTWQIKGVPRIRALDDSLPARIDALQEEVKNTRNRNDELTMQLLEQREEIERFQLEISKNSETSEVMLGRLERAEMLAGFTDVEGTGVVVTLNDRSANIDTEFSIDPNWGLIHDDMLLLVINELRAAGAEAISLNDERIISTTEIRCTGPTVTVNKNRYTTPFVIRAIGDPAMIESALRMKGGAKDYIELFGAIIDIRKSTNVVVKRYTGSFNMQHATSTRKEVTQ